MSSGHGKISFLSGCGERRSGAGDVGGERPGPAESGVTDDDLGDRHRGGDRPLKGARQRRTLGAGARLAAPNEEAAAHAERAPHGSELVCIVADALSSDSARGESNRAR